MKVDLPLFVYISSSSKGLFIWEARQPGISEISLDSYHPIGHFFSFVWTGGLIALQAESHLNLA